MLYDRRIASPKTKGYGYSSYSPLQKNYAYENCLPFGWLAVGLAPFLSDVNQIGLESSSFWRCNVHSSRNFALFGRQLPGFSLPGFCVPFIGTCTCTYNRMNASIFTCLHSNTLFIHISMHVYIIQTFIHTYLRVYMIHTYIYTCKITPINT